MKTSDVTVVHRTWANLRSGTAQAAREAAGVTLEQMAGIVGVSPASVGYWEAGDVAPASGQALAYGNHLRELAQAARRCTGCGYLRSHCACR
jgi:DNA-binding XRE family transcriptional regulator